MFIVTREGVDKLDITTTLTYPVCPRFSNDTGLPLWSVGWTDKIDIPLGPVELFSIFTIHGFTPFTVGRFPLLSKHDCILESAKPYATFSALFRLTSCA